MIYDCFTYAGEEDLLTLRLRTLGGHVDRFVIAEATRTFTGKDKPLRFDPARFAPWADRIDYLVVDDLDPAPDSAWSNEFRQRNALARGLTGAAPQDWVLLSDVDEIPRPQALREFRPDRYLSAVLRQRMFYYAFNNEMVRSSDPKDVPWRMARICTVQRLHGWFGSLQSLRKYRSTGPLRSAKRVWNQWRTQEIADGGWHFSYLMTPEQILQKIQAFSHQEFNLPRYADVAHIRDSLRQRRDLFGGDREFRVVPLDAGFPEPLRTEPEKYARWVI
jgi:beta-1,4-mannosyl-glycoprotein beta-1,4-N-acetylglucosaminyltransferase